MVLEELIDELSSLPHINVSSRSTSLYVHNNPTPVVELKEKLDVDFVVEGSIAKLKDEYKIHTKLISRKNEETIFKSKHELKLKNCQK